MADKLESRTHKKSYLHLTFTIRDSSPNLKDLRVFNPHYYEWAKNKNRQTRCLWISSAVFIRGSPRINLLEFSMNERFFSINKPRFFFSNIISSRGKKLVPKYNKKGRRIKKPEHWLWMGKSFYWYPRASLC